MGFKTIVRRERCQGEMKDGSYLGLGYHQRRKGYRRERVNHFLVLMVSGCWRGTSA